MRELALEQDRDYRLRCSECNVSLGTLPDADLGVFFFFFLEGSLFGCFGAP